MDAYATEEQQVEALKRWFKQYGNLISWVVIIIALLGSGIMYWRHHQMVVQEQASDRYLSLLEGLEKKDKETVKINADLLIKQYAKSSYAVLASFVLALEAIEEKDLEKAAQHLQWIIDNSNQKDFQALASIRLMRVLIAENKLDEALKLYNENMAGPFLTLMAELKGDILLKQNQSNAAKKAYELAYQSAPEEGMHGPLLKMKMASLGVEATPKNEANKS